MPKEIAYEIRRCTQAGIHDKHEWKGDDKGPTFYCPGHYVFWEVPRDSTLSHPMTLKGIDGLTEMMLRQRKLQEKSFGHDFDHMSEEDRVVYAKNQILALLDEAHEALAEIGWKPWATSRHMNRDAFVSELVDVWHFLMNLLIVAQVKPHEFFSLYIAKNEKNARRQAEGYDGVSTKCPACKRAYDDTAVHCTPVGDEGDPSAWCEKENGYV